MLRCVPCKRAVADHVRGARPAESWFRSLVPLADKARRLVPHDGGLPRSFDGSASALIFSRPGTTPGVVRRSLTLRPACSRNRHAILSIESSDGFVASTAASIATGRSDPIAGRDLHPLKHNTFPRRTELADLHFGLGVERDAERFRVAGGLRMDLSQMVEDGVGFGNFF